MKQLKITAFITSCLSVLCACSILIQLQQFVDYYTLAFITAFVVFMLIVFETLKVRELGKFFNNEKASKAIITLTFTISLVLSCLGMYFWVNKTKDHEMQTNATFSNSQLLLEKRYNSKIDSVANICNESKAYKELLNDISFWQNRKSANVAERTQIRQKIWNLQKRSSELETNFNRMIQDQIARLKQQKDFELLSIEHTQATETGKQDKNTFLFYILFGLVISTEIGIVLLQKQISKYYTFDQKRHMKALRSLMTPDREILEIDNICYDPYYNPNNIEYQIIREEAVKFWFLLKFLGILDKNKKDLGTIIKNKDSHQILENYYCQLNTIF